MSLIFMFLSIFHLIKDKSFFVYKIRYDDLCAGKKNCQIPVFIKKYVRGPIFVYMQITNFA